jgi:hypothetical protein
MSQRVDLPAELQFEIKTDFHFVNVRLKSGKIYRNVVCWNGQYLKGFAVGGWDGIRDDDLPFQTSDIAAIRKQRTSDAIACVRTVKERLRLL